MSGGEAPQADWAPIYAATLVPSPGVRAIPHLEAFLPECAALVRGIARAADRRIDSVAGWGFKPTSRYARAVAAARGLPYLALEDGFLRSVGLGEAGAPALSLVVDDEGIYYDAHRPSRLESLVQAGAHETPALIARADAAMAAIVAAGLSKTNSAPPLSDAALPPRAGRRVLVIDQTAGDASIEGGLASRKTFAAMLETARREEADAEIVVRRHPAVAAGLKRGCLEDHELEGVTVLSADARIADILARVDAVYTVSSLTGFEALLRGLPVRCFGLPFYAGWGVTRDDIASPRRTRKPTISQIFAAAYLVYARYVDPLTGEATTAENAIDRLTDFRDRADRHAGYTACVGFAPWKHGAARTLLYSPRGRCDFFVRPESAARAATAKRGRVVFWAGRESDDLRARLSRLAAPILRMEDGFIRSRGLGSDFHRAASAVLDDLGVYYDPTRPSRLEAILQEGGFDADLIARAERLRRTLVAARLSKYNLGGETALAASWPADRFKLLVVGQVENDRSIALGCEDISTNRDLLAAAREAQPDAFIVYKPHPDVEAGNRPGAVAARDTDALADVTAEKADIDRCLAAADGLATMTSLAGFEALMRGKPVWTFGRPFYGGWGLTRDRLGYPRRTRPLTLAELVAGTLILYPIYIDPRTGLPCRPEDLIRALAAPAAADARPGPKRLRYLRAVLESLRTSAAARF